MAVVVTVAVADVPPKMRKAALLRLSRWAMSYDLQAAEHKTAFKVVIIDEQITGKGGIIEVRLQKLGCAFQHAAIIYKLLGIFFFARPLAAIGFTEIVENGAIITAAAEG